MIPASSFNRTLSELAPGLAKRFFTCSSRSNHGLRSELQATRGVQGLAQPARKSGLRIRQFSSKWSSTSTKDEHAWRPAAKPTLLPRSNRNTKSKWTRPFSASARSRSAHETETVGGGAQSGEDNASTYPKVSTNAVGYWLLASAASVFGITVFGGLTRLTESG